MPRNGLKRRIYDTIIVGQARLHTLFYTGAQNSYITRAASGRCRLHRQELKSPVRTGLGGKRHSIREFVVVQGSLRKFPLFVDALVVDELGRSDEGAEIDMVFGILAMERWGVDPDVQHKTIDVTHFKREFTEYSG